MPDDFYTIAGYRLKNHPSFSSAMEDYLEMICRIYQKEPYVRVSVLAKELHVMPSSASKMLLKLKQSKLVSYEKYGIISPTQNGLAFGQYLLHRHDVLCRFFRYLNQDSFSLEEVEQIEHFISPKTVGNLEKLLHKTD